MLEPRRIKSSSNPLTKQSKSLVNLKILKKKGQDINQLRNDNSQKKRDTSTGLREKETRSLTKMKRVRIKKIRKDSTLSVKNAIERKHNLESCVEKENNVTMSSFGLSLSKMSPNWKQYSSCTKKRFCSFTTTEKTEHNISNPRSNELRVSLRDPSWPLAVGLDCEMVGGGANGSVNFLAKIAIVDECGKILMNKFVKPNGKIVDFRKRITGIHWDDLKTAVPFEKVREEAIKLLEDKIIVGHALNNDFNALRWYPDDSVVRDTSHYIPLRHGVPGLNPNRTLGVSLKRLSLYWLNRNIQNGIHDPVEDAQAALELYLLHRKHWEAKMNCEV